ncbi:GroES-like protein [Cylindrobasidium torrendii FP15055 ss-10]|uniref:GroES-like protein n=1 Tax=Cylindrobasidium torrendii FP15055 ss-10 TaxID=1314674 RepID=A0A0D7BIJ1_9AGAR|nr:GroES-like protein [Cylindrobasidium torrendii FP15055 ss-10]
MESAKQLAVVIPSLRGGFHLMDIARPSKPGPGKILLKVMVAGLNPADWKIHDYNIHIPGYPFVPGSDFAGTVEEVGEGVVGWQKGDRLMYSSSGGAFQQYAEIDAGDSQIPDNLSLESAATMPIAFATAVIGLFAGGTSGIGINPTISWDKPCAGQSALVIAGSSCVGQYAIQLLKFSGFTAIVAYASSRHSEFLKSLGATEVIDRNEVSLVDLPTYIKATFDVVFDALSGTDALTAARHLLADGGKCATVQPPTILTPDLHGLFAKENKKLAGIFALYKSSPESEALGVALRENLGRLVNDGVIKPNRYEVLAGGLKGVIEGTERHRQGKVSGVKLIVLPHASE